MWHYKSFDKNGVFQGLMTCSMHLESSSTQVEITKEEYDELLTQMQENEDLGVFDPNYNQE